MYFSKMDTTLFNSIPQVVLEDEYLLLQDLYTKGDDIQKLSVIQALPQLLQCDPNGTLTRIVPKIQQELPKSSCEFHIATSKIFKLLIEKQLPLNLTNAVIQGTESKDPVVSTAWMETLLAVIPTLSLEQIKICVLPLALMKSQPSSPVYCRVASCKIFGKCAAHPKIESIDVKSVILPAVQSLCQDCFPDVRATMCTQLPLIAQGLGENLVKSSLLPSLVELAADDNVSVRSAAVAASVSIIPFLNKETKIETIVPLIKQLCQKPIGGFGDPTLPTIAREFGKLVDALKQDLDVNDCIWMLQFYKSLATRGIAVRVTKDNFEVTQDVICREQCAFNLPAITLFTVSRISNQLDLWHSVFSGLANDSCYLVRKTTAGCIHEIARILGPQCKIIIDDFIKLLRDDAEEVLQMLVPHVSKTLELLCLHGVLSRETTLPASLEIAKALLKCHVELSKIYNWRIKTEFLQQMERLPNCMPSDFIHQHFSPVVLNCVLDARPKPLRSQASRSLLIFLRYNVKEIQRKWIRDNLITHLCYSKSCYTRHIFILACGHAMELFSNTYFKKHFFEPLLSLSDDPISNIRLCVVGLLPSLFKMLVLPEDRKLQTTIDNIFSKLEMLEKDKDVKDIMKIKLKEVRTMGTINQQEYLIEQKRKEEEENKIYQGKSLPISSNTYAVAGNNNSNGRVSKEQVTTNTTRPAAAARSTSAPPRAVRSSQTQLTSDMSFLEQHFYIDAGVSLPREKLDASSRSFSDTDVHQISETVEQTLCLTISQDETVTIPTVSVENVDLETMSESDLKKLETSTTNITDDVKVNLRKRNTKVSSKIVPPKVFSQPKESYSTILKRNRNSSVLSPDCGIGNFSKKSFNRRSLNLGASDMSKIPVCLKKSKSNADVQKGVHKEESTKLITKEKKNDRKKELDDVPANVETLQCVYTNSKQRPRSEILMNTDSKDKWNFLTDKNDPKCVNNSTANNSIKHDVPIANSIKDNNALKPSALPVFKRRTQSEARR